MILKILNNTLHLIACLTLETNMKIKLELELDTEKQTDLELIEDLLAELTTFREILEAKQQNLNKRQRK